MSVSAWMWASIKRVVAASREEVEAEDIETTADGLFTSIVMSWLSDRQDWTSVAVIIAKKEECEESD